MMMMIVCCLYKYNTEYQQQNILEFQSFTYRIRYRQKNIIPSLFKFVHRYDIMGTLKVCRTISVIKELSFTLLQCALRGMSLYCN